MSLANDYVIEEKIASGAFSVVWKAIRKSDGRDVAIKEIPLHTLHLNRRMRGEMRAQSDEDEEVHILRRISHPNVVQLLDFFEDETRAYLVLEYCGGGDLATFIKEKGRVEEATARKFMQQLGAGLQVLHANNLIHRDLKPENLLLSTHDKEAILKISDFGLARNLDPGTYADFVCGSPLYMAPEILRFQKYDSKADLWSVGVILFQLITGDTPYHGQNHVQILRAIKKRRTLHFPRYIADDLDPYCVDLCQKLLCIDPVKRLVFKDFVSHKFLKML